MRGIFVFLLLLILTWCSGQVHNAHIHSHQKSKEHKDGHRIGGVPHSHSNDGLEFHHEVIAGSMEAAEEYDTVSEAESKRRLALLLTKMDLNGDRMIEAQELYAWIVKSLKKLAVEEANDFFDDADSDNNGEVTWEEHFADTYGNDFKIGDNSDELMLVSDKRLFRAADVDRSGTLNRIEYSRFVHPEDYSDMFEVLIENRLVDTDKNKDGKIDFAEFVGFSGEKSEDYLAKKAKFENEYDSDRDGVLVGNEILMWAVPNNTQIAIEETKHLFASADDDHDSILSFDEILNHHGVFVGSEATDYGDFIENIENIMNDEL